MVEKGKDLVKKDSDSCAEEGLYVGENWQSRGSCDCRKDPYSTYICPNHAASCSVKGNGFDHVLLLLTKARAVQIHALSLCSQASSSRLEASKSKLEALQSAPENSKPGSRPRNRNSRAPSQSSRPIAVRPYASPPSGNILGITLSARESNDDDSSITDKRALESKQRSIHASKPAQDNNLPANPSIASADVYIPSKGPDNNAALTTTATRKCKKLPPPHPPRRRHIEPPPPIQSTF